MNILAINCSAHEAKGGTQEILSPFLEGARSAGAETKTAFLNELNLRPCLGCYCCWVKTPGFCIQNDNTEDLQITPIHNLYNLGDATKPSGKAGLPSCAETGIRVANEVKKNINPK